MEEKYYHLMSLFLFYEYTVKILNFRIWAFFLLLLPSICIGQARKFFAKLEDGEFCERFLQLMKLPGWPWHSLNPAR